MSGLRRVIRVLIALPFVVAVIPVVWAISVFGAFFITVEEAWNGGATMEDDGFLYLGAIFADFVLPDPRP